MILHSDLRRFIGNVQAWPYLLLVGGAIALAWTLVASQGVHDVGDQIHHYQISRFSWDYPELFLNHWGKPLFTLLSSPFAQFGYKGVGLFNIFVFLATGILALDVLKRLGAHWSASFLLIALLATAPQYVLMILAGMTEILFGLLTVLVIWLAVRKQYRCMAITASFMFYSRPESAVFVPIVAGWLAWNRAWVALPWLLCAPIIYGVVGAFHHGSVFWLLTDNPYIGAADIYGSGELDHFYSHRREIFGNGFFLLFLATIPLLLLDIKRGGRSAGSTLIALLATMPVITTFAIHSYAWFAGAFSSLGLIRVLAVTVPVAALSAAWGVSVFATLVENLPTSPWWTQRGMALGVIAMLAWGLVDLHATADIPFARTEQQRHMDRAAQWVIENRPDNAVAYLNPYLGFRADIDPYAGSNKLIWNLDKAQAFAGLNEGDWVLWDGHFSPNEGRFPLARAFAGDFRVVAYLPPLTEMYVLGGYLFELYVLEASPSQERRDTAIYRWPEVGSANDLEAEFPLRWVRSSPDVENYVFKDVILSFEATKKLPEGALLIYKASGVKGGTLIRKQRVGGCEQGTLAVRLPKWETGVTEEFAVWCPARDCMGVEVSFRVKEERVSYL